MRQNINIQVGQIRVSKWAIPEYRTHPAGNWKQYASDALGNLVMVLEPDPTANPVPGPPTPSAYPVTAAPTGMLLTTYTYDQFNHLTQVSMPRNTANGMVTQTRTFVYTPTTYTNLVLPALWLVTAANPENGTVSYTYNADGTLASKKDAMQNTETYAYDAYQRLTSIPDRGQTFVYDTCPTNATGCVSMAVTASYVYDNQGALTSLTYPAGGPPTTLNYTLDAMERPTAMTGWVSGVTYNAANQMLFDGIQHWTYNSLLQVTSVTGPNMNMTYNYSSTRNNGQITSSVDATSGETITYNYDALKRLIQATGAGWGDKYVYDGWGNMTQMNPTAGNPPSLNVTADPTTNRLTVTGASYNANGSLTAAAGVGYQYDAANRLQTVQKNGNYNYAYDAQNLRTYFCNASGSETIYFYGIDGKKLATYTYSITGSSGNYAIQLTQQSQNVYFAGRLISSEGNAVSTDRLASVRWGGPNGSGLSGAISVWDGIYGSRPMIARSTPRTRATACREWIMR